MTPTTLGEYIAAVGITLSLLFWVNVFVTGFFGFFDKDEK